MSDQRTRHFRVEKGSPSEEELAALTVVLLARATAGGVPAPAAEPSRPVARWRRLERATVFGGPRSWRRAA
ncbi:acyl-CoA carboxylase subunit epsilon [Streptomyces sp. NPDC017086]|uniref:acyl-CoA carboxylase subunit epsilon n=1 Tax=Streptomyces sp. NPDC017086 TaxID=3364976 RepID=UPI0037A03729